MPIGVIESLDHEARGITRLEGKRKLGQNREQRDFDGTVRALEARGDTALASAMQRSRR